MFPDSADQLCLDLKMRLRDATRSKVNLALLKYASETNCRWLSRLGVSPANYLKVNLEETLMATGTFDAESQPLMGLVGTSTPAGANGGINLSTD